MHIRRMEVHVVVFLCKFGKIKYDYHECKMNILTNKNYHKKIYVLTSPTIPHFQLSLKNLQSYGHLKKKSHSCIKTHFGAKKLHSKVKFIKWV